MGWRDQWLVSLRLDRLLGEVPKGPIVSLAESSGAGSAALRDYPGSKAADGVYHRIIGLMPPHELYIEAFVGSGAIFRNKRPAKASIIIDIDADVARYWRAHRPASTTVICGDARSRLRDRTYTGRELVYCDPPYPRSTRRWQFPLYRHEMTDKQHRELLATLKRLPCKVMISGYRCALYDRALTAWHRIDYLAPIHRPPHFAVESLWFNYQLEALHDWRYLGNGFRERERIKRKQSRWRQRLSSMPAMERLAMLDLLLELATPGTARGSR